MDSDKLIEDYKFYVQNSLKSYSLSYPGTPGSISYMQGKISIFGDNYKEFAINITNELNSVYRRYREFHEDLDEVIKNKLIEVINEGHTEFKKRFWD